MATMFCGSKQTYGEKPKGFHLEEDGDLYYIGSEVKHTFFILKIVLEFDQIFTIRTVYLNLILVEDGRLEAA